MSPGPGRVRRAPNPGGSLLLLRRVAAVLLELSQSFAASLAATDATCAAVALGSETISRWAASRVVALTWNRAARLTVASVTTAQLLAFAAGTWPLQRSRREADLTCLSCGEAVMVVTLYSPGLTPPTDRLGLAKEAGMTFDDAGEESVWDYPRPPALVPCAQRIVVVFADVKVAESTRSLRVLETSHPPVYYLPAADVRLDLMEPTPGDTWCEWKGRARYWDLRVGDRVSRRAAWSYPEPSPAFEAIKDAVAFYPGRVDSCRVDAEVVFAQPGDFYGGWITCRIRGPFKGAPGTAGW